MSTSMPISDGLQDAMRVLANDYDLPGPFTVLQGTAGDGLANTIDSMPEFFFDGTTDADADADANANDTAGNAADDDRTSSDWQRNANQGQGRGGGGKMRKNDLTRILTNQREGRRKGDEEQDQDQDQKQQGALTATASGGLESSIESIVSSSSIPREITGGYNDGDDNKQVVRAAAAASARLILPNCDISSSSSSSSSDEDETTLDLDEKHQSLHPRSRQEGPYPYEHRKSLRQQQRQQQRQKGNKQRQKFDISDLIRDNHISFGESSSKEDEIHDNDHDLDANNDQAQDQDHDHDQAQDHDADLFSIVESNSEASSMEMILHSHANPNPNRSPLSTPTSTTSSASSPAERQNLNASNRSSSSGSVSVRNQHNNEAMSMELTSTRSTARATRARATRAREDQPAVGLHMPLPPVVASLGYSSILPPVGVGVGAGVGSSAGVNLRNVGHETAQAPRILESGDGDEANNNNDAAMDIGKRSANNPKYDKLSNQNKRAIQQWNQICRENEWTAMNEAEAALRLTQSSSTASTSISSPRGMNLSVSNTASNPASASPSASASASNTTSSFTSLYQNQWWKSERNCLLIFDAPPMIHTPSDARSIGESGKIHEVQGGKGNHLGMTIGNVIGELTPGSTVMGVDKFSFEMSQFTPSTSVSTSVSVSASASASTRMNKGKGQNLKEDTVEILKIESPQTGYVVFSINGYPLLGPGLPSTYTEPEVWIWRVSCTAGAYVRQGLELTSVHVETIPYGSLLQVKRKTINAMGLSRLMIEAYLWSEDDENSIDEEGVDVMGSRRMPPDRDGPGSGLKEALRSLTLRKRDANLNKSRWRSSRSAPLRNETKAEKKMHVKKVVGWISEALNPLSGQTGPIVQPVSLPVPALYRVTLPEGAVIRQGLELSSTQIGHAPRGSILNVVGRAYSQHPMDRCIQRLKLAGGGGWVSVLLNRKPPQDQLSVLEQIGIDGSFDPDEAGLFHLERQLQVLEEINANQGCDGVQPQPGNEEGGQQNATNEGRSLGRLNSCISSINDEDETLENSVDLSSNNDSSLTSSVVPALYRSGVADFGSSTQASLKCGSKKQKDDPCLICLTEERNATIVHGETGHIACCLTCARLLKGRGDKCPVCRLPIDLIIQQFWA